MLLAGYGSSKAALNHIVMRVHLEHPSLTAFVVHPGQPHHHGTKLESPQNGANTCLLAIYSLTYSLTLSLSLSLTLSLSLSSSLSFFPLCCLPLCSALALLVRSCRLGADRHGQCGCESGWHGTGTYHHRRLLQPRASDHTRRQARHARREILGRGPHRHRPAVVSGTRENQWAAVNIGGVARVSVCRSRRRMQRSTSRSSDGHTVECQLQAQLDCFLLSCLSAMR